MLKSFSESVLPFKPDHIQLSYYLSPNQKLISLNHLPPIPPHKSVFFFNIHLFLFIWLHQVLVAACKLLVVVCGIQFLDKGSNPGPLPWELRVSATGPPGKSPKSKACLYVILGPLILITHFPWYIPQRELEVKPTYQREVNTVCIHNTVFSLLQHSSQLCYEFIMYVIVFLISVFPTRLQRLDLPCSL